MILLRRLPARVIPARASTARLSFVLTGYRGSQPRDRLRVVEALDQPPIRVTLTGRIVYPSMTRPADEAEVVECFFPPVRPQKPVVRIGRPVRAAGHFAFPLAAGEEFALEFRGDRILGVAGGTDSTAGEGHAAASSSMLTWASPSSHRLTRLMWRHAFLIAPDSQVQL